MSIDVDDLVEKYKPTERKLRKSSESIDTLVAKVFAKHGESYGMSMILNHSRNGHIRNRRALEKALLEPCESLDHKTKREVFELQVKKLIQRSAITQDCKS